MGQRLVVELTEHDSVAASIYFHWSAYFAPAIQELKFLCDDILEAEENKEDVLLAILKGLEKRGGGLRGTQEDIIKAKKLYPFHEFKDPNKVNRNDGIMTFIAEGIASFRAWADGTAYINLDTRRISNMCFGEAEPFSITRGEEKPQCVVYKNIICPIDPSNMTYTTVQTLYEFMDKRFEELE